MSLPVWLIPILEAAGERLLEKIARGETVVAISLGELLDEAARNEIARRTALEAARRRIEARYARKEETP